MSVNLRHKVLRSFKQLHKTKDIVFKGDKYALGEARKKINEEFKKQKHVTDLKAIEELINYANSVDNELKTCVIQARQVAPGKYEVEIRKDTVKLDNVPFNDCSNQEKVKK